MTLPPVRFTDRMILRPLSMVDSAGMFALWSDADVCRHAGDARDWWGEPIALPAQSPADSDRIIDFFLRHAAQDAGFRWAMVDRRTGRFVGAIGFNHLTPVAEVAYHLIREAWGRGYAREGLDGALRWAADFGCRQVEAWIDPANRRSLALIRGAAFQPSGATRDGASRFVRFLA